MTADVRLQGDSVRTNLQPNHGTPMNMQTEGSVLEANNAAQLLRRTERFEQRIPFCVIPSTLQRYLMSVVGVWL